MKIMLIMVLFIIEWKSSQGYYRLNAKHSNEIRNTEDPFNTITLSL